MTNEDIATITWGLYDLSRVRRENTELRASLKAAEYKAQCWETVAKNAQLLNDELRKLLPKEHGTL